MKRTNYAIRIGIGIAFGAALLGALTGCIVAPQPRAVYGSPPPVYVAAGGGFEDDYLYYPGYQVYYSSHRRQYVYLQGNAWVSRPAPPRVSVDVLFASPSVRLDFHDAPSLHHATVVRQYPKHWVPPAAGNNHGQGNGNGNDGHGNDRNGPGK